MPRKISQRNRNDADLKRASMALDDFVWSLQKINIVELKEAAKNLFLNLSAVNSAAQNDLKKLFWTNVPNWEGILFERAKMSAKLLMTKEVQVKLASLG